MWQAVTLLNLRMHLQSTELCKSYLTHGIERFWNNPYIYIYIHLIVYLCLFIHLLKGPIQAPSSSVSSSTLLTKTTLITKSSLKPYTSNIQQSSSNLLPLASPWKSRASTVVSSSKPSALHTTVPTSSEWTSMVNSSPRAQSSGVLSTRTIKASKSSTTIIVPSSPIGLATFSRYPRRLHKSFSISCSHHQIFLCKPANFCYLIY